MRAVIQDRYGTAEVLHVEEVAVPMVADGEVLVRVHAAGVDRGTWHLNGPALPGPARVRDSAAQEPGARHGRRRNRGGCRFSRDEVQGR